MDTWVRLASGDTWHLLANTTGNGLRLAYCAKTFAPGEALARRALADTPASAQYLSDMRGGSVPTTRREPCNSVALADTLRLRRQLVQTLESVAKQARLGSAQRSTHTRLSTTS